MRGGSLARMVFHLAVICFLLQLLTIPSARAQSVRTVFLIRHADKASDEADAPLSDAGRRRAACLADMLSDARVARIFTSDLQRTQQTAAPLAARLHLTPVAIPLAHPERLVEAVRASKGGNIVVVWHDQTLPKIIQDLGGPDIPPIAHTEYDRFLILTWPLEKAESTANLITLRYCDELK